jgi:hypothetical protein
MQTLDEPKNKLLSIIKLLEKGNFLFECRVSNKSFDYVANINFLETIEHQMLTPEFPAEKDQKYPKIPADIFLTMITKIIQKIIENHEYKIIEKFSEFTGISILFSHSFLFENYILRLKPAIFQKEYTEISDDKIKPLVIELLNKYEEQRKNAIKSSITLFSRKKFIESGYWEKSPFDFAYNNDELFEKSGELKQFVIDELCEQRNGIEYHILRGSGISRSNNAVFKDFQTNFPVISIISLSTDNYRISQYFKKNNTIISYNKKKKHDSCLRIIKSDDKYELRGDLFVKSNQTTKGSLINCQNIQDSSDNQHTFIIGLIENDDLPVHLYTPYFLVKYEKIKVLHQIQLQNKKLLMKFIPTEHNKQVLEKVYEMVINPITAISLQAEYLSPAINLILPFFA